MKENCRHNIEHEGWTIEENGKGLRCTQCGKQWFDLERASIKDLLSEEDS